MDQFMDNFILNRTCRCFNTKHAFKMLPSIVGGRPITPVFMLYLCSKTRCLILFQIAAAASYKKVVKPNGKIAIK